jgi:hypothetical protein
MDVDLKASARSRDEIIADIRSRLASLPAASNVGQPISHRLDHLLSGVRAQIALKIYGDDLDTLRGLAAEMRDRLARIPGVTDLQIEKQVLIPQVKIRLDYEQAARYGVAPGNLLRGLEQMIEGERITQIIEGNRRFDLLVRLPESARGPAGAGRPADRDADRLCPAVQDRQRRGKRRPQPGQPRELAPPHRALRQHRRPRHVEGDRRHPRRIGRQAHARGLFHRARRAVPGAGAGSRLITLLALVSLTMIFMVLYSRYRSMALTLIIMGNIPLALIGSVIALWISGQPLSVAALVGFITLTGIATRNGILKISHYINLCAFEGETFGQHMIVRGSLERLTPVLMTALVAAFALMPLLLSADAPGKEVLHPGGGGDLRRPDQLDPARYPADAGDVLAVGQARWSGCSPPTQSRKFLNPSSLTTQGDSHEVPKKALQSCRRRQCLRFGKPALLAHTDEYLDTQKAPNGGQLRMAGVYHFELVVAKDSKEAKDNAVVVYVTDHAGAKIATAAPPARRPSSLARQKATVKLAPRWRQPPEGDGQVRVDAGHEGRGVDHPGGQSGRAGALYPAGDAQGDGAGRL